MAPAEDTSNVLATASRLVASLRVLAHAQLQLLAWEAERAGQGLANIAVLSVVAGLLAASIWMGLSVALGFWLVELQWRTSVAVLLVAGLNLLGLMLVMQAIRREMQVLGFPGTRHSLQALREPSPPVP